MCCNPKKMRFIGKYKTDNYHGKKGEPYDVEVFTKCGYCSQCIAEKANNWVIRNMYESRAHEKKCFITLTYAKNTYFLVKKDYQDFIKRLRRYFDYHKICDGIRYFIAGEYGTLKNRPHFHIIIYGWEDNNAKYIGLSKRGFPILQSKIIQKVWGLGRTTYQEFDDHELPYISLYDTARENESYIYKMKRKNAKKLVEKLKEDEKMHAKEWGNPLYIASRRNQIEQIEKALEEIKKTKEKYLTVREFNGWSTSMGWEKFFEEYNRNNNNYDFMEYIEDKEFYTPTSWVKKLANNGLEDARKEMLRRASQVNSELSESELTTLNNLRNGKAHVQELFKADKEREIEVEEYLKL